MHLLKTAISHRGSCFICSSKGKLRTVKKESIVKAYNDFKIVIKHKSLHCSRHVDEKGIIKKDEYHHIRYSLKYFDRKSLKLIDAFGKRCKADIFEQFNDIDSLEDNICLKVTGWTKNQFVRFCKYIPDLIFTHA